MAKDPAFLFYPGDYLQDTQCLSEASQVAYDRIMCEHMRNICITQQQLKFFTKKLTDLEKEELMMTLKQVEGGYQIEWVAKSICKRKEYSESRRLNRTKKHKNISSTYDKHMENENENENENINSRGIGGMGEKGNEVYVAEPFPTFNDAWEAYQNKVGRKAAETAWKRLKQHEREAAYTKIPLYVQSLSDRKFQAHLSTWLNGRRWEDEFNAIKKPLSRTFRDEQDLANFLAIRPDN